MIQGYWKDAVEAFVDDVTSAVDIHVRGALLSIRNERGISALGSSGVKRRHMESDTPVATQYRDRRSLENGGESAIGDVEDSPRAGKRKKTHAASPFRHESPDKHGSLDQIEIIKEMRKKIEKQTQALADLAKENNEVRAKRKSRRCRELTRRSEPVASRHVEDAFARTLTKPHG